MRLRPFAFLGLALVGVIAVQGARQQVSPDRDLKELDIAHWDCLNKPEGTAKTADGAERNRLKNRPMPEGPLPAAEESESAGFLKRISQFEALTKGRRRKELNPAQKQQLDPLEKQLVTMTGYLGLAYAGPPESTNCGSGDFHDWHLEVFEKPIEHAPQPGDPTPIICEITPRTQTAIFRDGIRIQELTAFFRQADLETVPTGHKAQKIRITGYLLWDDEHNGTADVGTAVRTLGANKFHNPWRSIAWEIHPVLKIERADGAGTKSVSHAPGTTVATPAPSGSAAPAEGESSPPEPSVAPTATPAPTVVQMVTLQIPLRIPTPAGEVVIPRGARLQVVSRDAQSVTVQYMGQNVIILNGYIDPR